LRKVQREFGTHGSRWLFRGEDIPGGYRLHFWFADPYDATIFALKYLE
jgi:hypothetical protein